MARKKDYISSAETKQRVYLEHTLNIYRNEYNKEVNSNDPNVARKDSYEAKIKYYEVLLDNLSERFKTKGDITKFALKSRK
tara:strand:+ start:382 stop:624 length:243 start_codon:yes stop_codon:yes gene_type:complete